MDLCSAVIRLMRRVGDFQCRFFRGTPPAETAEKAARELVSEVDLRSEELLLSGLCELLPEAGFYGEESGRHGDDALRWVVDPLDGTSNFLSGLDQFAISVALERRKVVELGVVLRPVSGEYYSAVRGQGLMRNGSPCRRTPRGGLSEALIGTGFPYRSRDLAGAFFPCAEEILYASRGLRRFGSAALDLCYVAAGTLQGFWESDLQPYDVAAGRLFLEENGCLLTNQHGAPYAPERDRLLISAGPEVHGDLLQIVARHYPAVSSSWS